MIIQTTRNNNDTRTIRKTFIDFSPLIKTGTFKMPYDYRKPTVIIDMRQYSTVFYPNVPNYARISKDDEPDENTVWRYYFITDIKFVNNDLCEISLELDVLMTYSGDILDRTAMIERNENEYDLMLEDKIRPLQGRKIVGVSELRKLSNCFSFSMESNWQSSPSTPAPQDARTIAMTVFVSEHGLGQIAYYMQSAYSSDPDIASCTEANQVIHFLTSNDIPNPILPSEQPNIPIDQINTGRVNPSLLVTYLLNEYVFLNMARKIAENEELASAFVSAVALPIPMTAFSNGKYTIPIWIGNTQMSLDPEATYAPYSMVSNYGQMTKFLLLNDHSFPYPESFLDIEPYTTYEIYIPYVGLVPISSSAILGKRILLYYQIDLTTGEATAYLTDADNKNVPIFSTTCKIGNRLSISSTNERQNENARNTSALNTAVGLISSMVGIAGGIATGNPIMSAGGAVLGARSIANAISTNLNIMERAQTSFNANFSGYYSRQVAYLRKTYSRFLQTAGNGLEEFRHEYGLPLNKPRKLGNLTGMTLVSAIHLDGFSAPKPVKDEIETLLKTGVII